MKRRTRLYGAILCLGMVTAVVTAAVKTDIFKFFKYLCAKATFTDSPGWVLTDDGSIRSDRPDGVEIVYDIRPETSEHPGPYLKRQPQPETVFAANSNSNGENSEP